MITICLEEKRVNAIVNNDIAVFIEDIHTFSDENYHPYFKKSYNLIIAKIHDYELSECCILLDYLDLFKGGRKILKRRRDIEKVADEVANHAKKLIDAIEKLYKLIPPKTLQRILANVHTP